MTGLAYVQDAKVILAVNSMNDLPLGGYHDSYVVADRLYVSSLTSIL